jgi:hypothetical protein
MLFFLNLFLILIIAGSLVLYTLSQQKEIRLLKEAQAKVTTELKSLKLNQNDLQATQVKLTAAQKQQQQQQLSLMELKEFASLEPVVKDFYKKYIVDKLIIGLEKSMNKAFQTPEVKDFLLNNDKLFSDMIDAIIKIYDVASEGGDATEAKAQLEALVGQLGAATTTKA